MSIKGYCGDTVCVTTQGTSPEENSQKLPEEMTDREKRAELKRLIMGMTEEQCAELLDAVKEVKQLSGRLRREGRA